MIMEMSLKRLDGVDRVAISASKQMFAVFFTEDAKTFDAAGMRAAVGNASVKVVKFHLQGQGKVEEEGDKQYLTVTPNARFLVIETAKLPANSKIGFIGSVNDTAQPMEIKLDDWKPVPAK